MPRQWLRITGAREHNLKNITVDIPRNELVVLTGLSGSGKSSLAFDTIFAEGQRRYLESLSAYVRQYLEQMKKPNVDAIEGLSPVISIEQKKIFTNPRSTVGTITEIYDYLRLLYSRVGLPHCFKCHKPIKSQSPQEILTSILSNGEGTRICILAPIIRGKKGEYLNELLELRSKGFVRAKIDGKATELSDVKRLQKSLRHTISVYIDRLILKTGIEKRLLDAIEIGTQLGSGLVEIEFADREETVLFSTEFACFNCGVNFPEIEPRTFSFNSPYGACPKCNGLGEEPFIDSNFQANLLTPMSEDEFENDPKNVSFRNCSQCDGTRLKKETLSITLNGKNIHNLATLSISDLGQFFKTFSLDSEVQSFISKPIIKEISDRIHFLVEVGLSYLSLSRSAKSLSGGEAQRIHLASQLGASLVGVLYILDEPSIGLHQRDNDKLITALERLRDSGNSVIVVEHDRDIIEHANYIVDLGPYAGIQGGHVTFTGSPRDIAKAINSETALYLTGAKSIPTPLKRRDLSQRNFISITDAKKNNLKNINVIFPLGHFICVTGVSGSGKSSLVLDTLLNGLKNGALASNCNQIDGLSLIDRIVFVDQSPIGRTPRSNPATFTGLFSDIRNLYSELPEAKIRGYKSGRFSFNVAGGRCDICEGAGSIKMVMHFLPDIYVPCDTCLGSRYNKETREIHYRDKCISEVLDMSVDDAYKFFSKIPQIKYKLRTLVDVGLGYLTLGQSAITLSGGEAQRIKLSRELSKRSTGKTLYVLDEPTTGLHFEDIKKLLEILHSLVNLGNTVVVVEHNLDVVKQADTVIDLGPEGGKEGGYLLFQGTPEALCDVQSSYTGKYLSKVLKLSG